MDDDFITFGCWNKGDPDDPSLPLYHLYEALDKYINDKPPKFIFITGDNYYPYGVDKEDSEYKTIKKEMIIKNEKVLGGGKGPKIGRNDYLFESFNKLTKMGRDYEIPILMCTGNHENPVEKPHIFPLSPKNPDTPPSSPERDDTNFDSDVFLSLKTLQDKQEYLLTVDNSKYPEKQNVYFKMDEPEKDHLINDTNIRIINTEEKTILDEPRPLGDIKFIFGHKPLFSLHFKKGKIKKGKQKPAQVWDINENVCKYFQLLSQHHKGKYVYICSDTHNYQDIDIKYEDDFNLRQIVIGSGGTFEMDLLSPDLKINEKLSEIIGASRITCIHINNSQTGKHGLCRCSLSEPGENEFMPYFDAVLGIPLFEDPQDKIIRLQRETERAVRERNKIPGSTSLNPQHGMLKKKSKKRKNKRKSKHKNKSKHKSKRKHKSKINNK